MKDTKWIRQQLYPTPVKHEWITFFLEAYIELIVSAVVAFKMYEFRDFWNNWDRFAIACHVTGIITTVSFFIFVCWFVYIKFKPFNRKMKLLKRK